MYGCHGCRKIPCRTELIPKTKIHNAPFGCVSFFNMKNLLLIFIGGGIGSMARYLMSTTTQKLWNLGGFPIGTYVVNIIGCFLIGFFTTTIVKSDESLKFLLITGFCGGFTTFSTFSSENYILWQSESYSLLFLNIILSIFLGLGAVFLGIKAETLYKF